MTGNDSLRLSERRKSGRLEKTMMVGQGNGQGEMSRTKSRRNNLVRNNLILHVSVLILVTEAYRMTRSRMEDPMANYVDTEV